MVTRTGRSRRKTRHKLSLPAGKKGKVPIRSYLQSFKEGEKVLLKADPSYQKGMYFPRFHGRVAVVKGHRGRSYEVAVREEGKMKTLVVNPVHLQKVRP